MTTMKNIEKLLLGLMVTGCMIACQQMKDIHEDFIKDGETIYAGRVYDPVVLPGEGRLRIKMFFKGGGSIRNCIIEWNDGENQVNTKYTPNVPLDSTEITINDLEEKSYLFYVHNLDKDGNRSIKVPVSGSAYGDIYRQSLSNRIVSSVEGGGTIDSVTINWGTVAEGNVGVVVTYPDSTEAQVSRILLPEENRLEIRGWKSEGTLSYITRYIPEEGAIDTFETQPRQFTLPKRIVFKGELLAKDNWEIVDFSSDEGEGRIGRVIDGDYSTYWHTQYNGAQPGYPHYFVVDLQNAVKMNKIEAFNRSGDTRGHTEFKLYCSMDGNNFTDLGTFDNDVNSTKTTCLLNDLPLARYVKFEATNGPNFFTFLAELDVYGQIQ